ncbi:MAG TPA: hypothetical protein ENF41_04395 [Candidatus Bathyarchaeota archaeon]|nr:hypothetical protein [Candidatus Bathyarchaeota archaeon]
MERKRIRFISEEPKLANILKRRKPIIIPDYLYMWSVQWIEDVGRVMRSREMMVSAVASALYYAGIMSLARFINIDAILPNIKVQFVRDFLARLFGRR